ncbi:Crp/Fnr family transcriptional regulator [Siphonobacter sp. SORGH_AS_1065]|uniref:Crp/Fnr family transcriptional regulator n=1 Tax=Siphonobacter sp. SORGH_AS_1065 TaxID=3041795 RepID=UPI0027814B84|nr:Crp/Fnr family transcriptional regulator [Siphonobacter sp. SORGH_AS_1065]MDQ1086538.1 CRP-like cAMP-binding protein [Siphonobacter sp. SORGH_AS_1065]
MSSIANQFRIYLKRFVELTDQEWDAFEKDLTIRTLPKKHFLIKQGQTAKEICFLISGSARLYYEKDGDEKTTYFFFENNLVGDYLGCLTSQPSTINIQALEDCELMYFKYETLTKLYEQFPVYQIFGRKLAEYLFMGLDIRLAELLTLTPEERYLKFINTSIKRKILERIPQQYIASYLGITPVSLSRIRRRIATS